MYKWDLIMTMNDKKHILLPIGFFTLYVIRYKRWNTNHQNLWDAFSSASCFMLCPFNTIGISFWDPKYLFTNPLQDHQRALCHVPSKPRLYLIAYLFKNIDIFKPLRSTTINEMYAMSVQVHRYILCNKLTRTLICLCYHPKAIKIFSAFSLQVHHYF